MTPFACAHSLELLSMALALASEKPALFVFASFSGTLRVNQGSSLV